MGFLLTKGMDSIDANDDDIKPIEESASMAEDGAEDALAAEISADQAREKLNQTLTTVRNIVFGGSKALVSVRFKLIAKVSGALNIAKVSGALSNECLCCNEGTTAEPARPAW